MPGFLWLGTQNGLAKYDGYSMVVYRQDPDDPGSISDNDIPSLYEDRAGVLWVGTTYGGLNKFNRGNGTFTRYPANPLDSGSIGFSHVSCVHVDSSDRLWVAYGDGGLCLLDRKTGTFTRYYLQEKSYGPEVYAYLSGLQKRGHQLGSIAMVGDNANITTRFTLNQKATVLLVVMGEGVADYGWLENERGQIVAQYNSRTSLHAGGRPDNRIHISLMPLDAGLYRIRYRSDDIHSYGRWSGEAPTHPEFWGIRVFDVSGEVENARRTLEAHQPVNLPTRVWNGKRPGPCRSIIIWRSSNRKVQRDNTPIN